MNTSIENSREDIKRVSISFVIYAACAFVQIIAIGSLPLLPFIGMDLQASTSSMQLIIPVYLSGIITSQFVISFNAEIYGRRLVYLLSLAMAVIGLFLWMIATSRWFMYTGIFIEAFGAGGLLSLSNAIIKDVFPAESHSRIFGILTIVMWVTAIVAPVVGGYLQQNIGWRYTLGVYGLIPAMILIVALFILPETASKVVTQNKTLNVLLKQSISLFNSKLFIASAIIGGAINAIPTAFNTLAPFLFLNVYGLSAKAIGDYLMIPGIGIFLGLICSELIGSRFTQLNLIRMGVYLCTLASLLLVLIGLFISTYNLALILFITSIAMFAMGLITPHYWSAALTPIKEISAVAASVVVLVQQIFAMITGFAISSLSASSIMPMTLTITSLSLVALLCSIFLLPGKLDESKSG